MANKFGLPMLGFGLGLRPDHYTHILENTPPVDWFEIISENYMDTEGRPRYMLEQVKEKYPIVMHGVSLSIGTVDAFHSEYLKQLKALIDWVDPVWVSDHLCWTGIAHKQTHDLLPVPYTEEALKHIVERLKEVQDYLERPILMENPSTYLEFQYSEMTEWDFINHMAKESNCGLLLDVNNVYVSCYNHKWDPKTYLDALPLEHVVQIHLAGHQNNGTHIIDTHDNHVTDEVWKLYQYLISTTGPISTMIEWDDKIPAFDIVFAELEKARHLAGSSKKANDLPQFPVNPNLINADNAVDYAPQLQNMQDAILKGDINDAKPEHWIRPKPELSAKEQLDIYIRGYRYRLFDVLYDDYEGLRHYLGDDDLAAYIDGYIETVPSMHPNIARYAEKFPEYIREHAEDIFAYELCLLETQIETIAAGKETTALTQEHLQNRNPEELMANPLPLRQALSLHHFTYPTNIYYTQFLNGEKPDKPEPKETYAAIYRHDNEMWRLDLEKEEYDILLELQKGRSVNDALQTVLKDKDDQEVAENISKWFARWMNNYLLANAA